MVYQRQKYKRKCLACGRVACLLFVLKFWENRRHLLLLLMIQACLYFKNTNFDLMFMEISFSIPSLVLFMKFHNFNTIMHVGRNGWYHVWYLHHFIFSWIIIASWIEQWDGMFFFMNVFGINYDKYLPAHVSNISTILQHHWAIFQDAKNNFLKCLNDLNYFYDVRVSITIMILNS